MSKDSLFRHAPDIVPRKIGKGMSIPDLVGLMGRTCFEARNVRRAAELFQRMVDQEDTIWLGIAGAGIAGGMGGMVISLIEAGFVNVICSTGAQVYHDLHFAFGLPVKSIHPDWDDDRLRRHGDTRIYDIGIREKETLEAQDSLIRRFVRERYERLHPDPISSWQFNYELGRWVADTAPHPELSFTVAAARCGVPIFWDSLANHSIAMNLVRTDHEGFPIQLSAQQDILHSAAIAFSAEQTGFVELGGGGPKNFIQQTGPTISQILGIDFEGADRGIQIGTAVEREGSLSSCTFGEAVTWGKYQQADEANLVQVWGEYSIIFPLLAAYITDRCAPRDTTDLCSRMKDMAAKLESAR
ncbi:deoxyhypusine synthase-like protein [Desulfosarcina widdelii]|uniref:Deoxyhypusine synthase-like protein n=1 Tax=Desulfosarcina widdelii TaxID=947919 RepID=A0A5K7YZG9_9BACT|nr:deoxyhypusine synthase family protein [Desulfosarcina widdelii]BBO74796.1 deoxyhypusine synthase-like protein [Desulfosarcina widdelii]